MSYGNYPGRVAPVRVPGLWWTVFSATLAAVLVGSLLVGLGVRAYVYWSVRDTVRQVGEKFEPPPPKYKP